MGEKKQNTADGGGLWPVWGPIVRAEIDRQTTLLGLTRKDPRIKIRTLHEMFNRGRLSSEPVAPKVETLGWILDALDRSWEWLLRKAKEAK